MSPRALLLALLLAAPGLALAAPGTPAPWVYSGAGTVVTSINVGLAQITALDNGAVQCRDADYDGIFEQGQGGVCITFAQMAGGDAIFVQDGSVAPHLLSFQVCVDNNGDGICSGNGENGAYNPSVCADRIYFSHHSSGGNLNPLFVDPQGVGAFFQQCARGGFPGYVVITCAGLHNNRLGTTPHSHDVTSGTVQPVHLGYNTGSGDFCGGLTAAKAYDVVVG